MFFVLGWWPLESKERAVIDLSSNEIIAILPDAIVVLDQSGKIVGINPKLLDTFGYSEKELEAAAIELLLPDYVHQTGTDLKATPAGAQTFTGRHKDGHPLQVEISIGPIKESLRVAVIRNVSERMRLEEELAEKEGRLRILLSHIDDIFYSVQGNPLCGTVTQVSDNATWITGYTPTEFMRDHTLWFSLVHPDDIAAVQESTFRLLRDRQTVTRQYRLRGKDGRYVWFEDKTTPQFNEDGTFAAMNGVARDVTLRRELEAQLFQASKMEAVGRFAGGIAHDFNNLLTVVNGMSTLLLESLPEGSDQAAYAAQIQKTSNRAAGLTRQLLAFSRQETLQLKPLNISIAVRRTQEMLLRLLPSNIKLRVTLNARRPYVIADDSYIEQVLMNLVINARDAMPTGGVIAMETLSVDLDPTDMPKFPELRPGSYTIIRVSDSGRGIDEEALSRIYEPFFTTKTSGTNSGLGLSIVYRLLQQIGGCVRVTSEVSHGTVASVYLPETAEEPARLPGTPTFVRKGNERVLVVDDDAGVADLARAILQNHGYAATAMHSPYAALQLVRGQTNPFDVVITDVMMPGMSGTQFAEALRNEGSNARILFVSGYAPEVLFDRTSDPPDFLAKPFSAKQLLECVRTILDSH
jgi:two-component system cell cycle sensor histidine kinase/response regulator CckA